MPVKGSTVSTSRYKIRNNEAYAIRGTPISGRVQNYYTESGYKIRNNEAYAITGAPMYKTKQLITNINTPTEIYKINLEEGKIYIGKTINIKRRMQEHFSGNGAKVTKKFKPLDFKILEKIPGYFSNDKENKYTKKYIKKYGYNNVRGGCYTNSKTLIKNTPHCHCKYPAKKRIVKMNTKNKGRRYWYCGGNKKKCKYFKWCN